MNSFSLSAESFTVALEDLKQFFGCNNLHYMLCHDNRTSTAGAGERPEDTTISDAGIGIEFGESVTVLISGETVWLMFPESTPDIMDSLRRLLGDSPFESRLRNVFFTLRWLIFRLDRAELTKDGRLSREDRLKLYLLCERNRGLQGWIGIKSAGGSVRLKNEGNHFFELLRELVACGIGNVQQAEEELNAIRRKRGRRAKDERCRAVLWGAYRMLSGILDFSPAMPNSLCDFLVRLLQQMGFAPDDSPIDRYWIRAELRYMRDRSTKPQLLP